MYRRFVLVSYGKLTFFIHYCRHGPRRRSPLDIVRERIFAHSTTIIEWGFQLNQISSSSIFVDHDDVHLSCVFVEEDDVTDENQSEKELK